MKTGNDLVAEQVRYSTCFCYLPNCANQHNFVALQRIAVLLPDSSIGCIDSFLSFHRACLCRHQAAPSVSYRDDGGGAAVHPHQPEEDRGGSVHPPAPDSRADTRPVQYHRHAQSRVPVAEPGFHLARDTGNRRDPGQAR